MTYPQPTQQDLLQLLDSLEEQYQRLEPVRSRVATVVPDLTHADQECNLLLFSSICNSLTAQLSQYMRLRRLIILPYLRELKGKEEDGHDCRNCGKNCKVQHSVHLISIQEAHSDIQELLDQLYPVAMTTNTDKCLEAEKSRQLKTDLTTLQQVLSDVLFIERSALLPMMRQLQKNIGAHE